MLRSTTLCLLITLELLAGCSEPEAASGVFPPLWTVISPEGQRSTLMGTIHGIVDASELSPALIERLAGSSSLTTEADVRFIRHDEYQRALTLPEDQRISEMVTGEQWAAIVEAFEGILEPESFDTLQPWYVERALTLALLPEAEPIDTALTREAQGRAVQLRFLETWQQQVQLLNDLGLDDGLAALLSTVEDTEAAVEANLAWAAAYRARDLEALERLAFAPELVESRPEFYESIVFGRNERWLASGLEERLGEGGAFVAVGFLHVFGDRGLPALLEARGFQVALVEP